MQGNGAMTTLNRLLIPSALPILYAAALQPLEGLTAVQFTSATHPNPVFSKISLFANLRFYLYLTLASLLIAAVLAEVWLRFFPPGPYITSSVLRNAHAMPMRRGFSPAAAWHNEHEICAR